MKMRIKTGHAVNLIERRLAARRQRFQLRFGQKSVAQLDRSQVVEDQWVSPETRLAQKTDVALAHNAVLVPCILISARHSVKSGVHSFAEHVNIEIRSR